VLAGAALWGCHGPPSPAVQLSVGNHYLCVLRKDTTIDCRMYENTQRDGQDADPDGDGWKEVATSAYATCALDADSMPRCWGGQEEFTGHTPPDEPFDHIFGGPNYFCGLRADGTAWCWGNLVVSGQVDQSLHFTKLSTHEDGSCGLTPDGTVVCWGYDRYGEATAPEGTFTDVDVGGAYSCGVRTDGHITCWGSNTIEEYPVIPDVPDRDDFVAVAVGGHHACGLTRDGEALCWGWAEYGQIDVPVGRRFTQIDAGKTSSCGLDENGNVTCWGCAPVGDAPGQCQGF